MSLNPKKQRGRIISGSAGSFLDPPEYPTHRFSIETDLRRRPENRSHLSLTYAAREAEWLDYETRKNARDLINKWRSNRPPIDSPEVKDWIHHVLGYFRHCYQSPSGSWTAQDLKIDPKADPVKNQNTHAGVHLIRKYYPEYIATEDDFKNAYWGTKPE